MQRSLVPRPLPVFNDTRKKREGLVREVTCTSFRWKAGRVIIVRGPVTCLRADLVLAVPIVPGTSIATVEYRSPLFSNSSSRTGLWILIASAPLMQSKSVSISQRRPIGQIVLSDKLASL